MSGFNYKRIWQNVGSVFRLYPYRLQWCRGIPGWPRHQRDCAEHIYDGALPIQTNGMPRVFYIVSVYEVSQDWGTVNMHCSGLNVDETCTQSFCTGFELLPGDCAVGECFG